MQLADDIFIDYRRDAQRAGFTDVQQMPLAERVATAQSVAEQYSDDIAAELEVHHPEWTSEEIAAATTQRIRDIVTLLTMNTDELDTYRQATFDYQEVIGQAVTLETEIAELRAERKKRMSGLGNFAVRGLVGVAGKLRDLPHAFNARMTIAGMAVAERVRKWYSEKSPEGKKTVWFTAASVAITGLATYVAVRLNGGHSPSSGNLPALDLVSDNAPDQMGNVAPHDLGNVAPHNLGSPLAAGDTLGSAQLGGVALDHMGGVVPAKVGTTLTAPHNFGGVSPDNLGGPSAPMHMGHQPVAPDNLGNVAPDTLGHRRAPDNLGGIAPDSLGNPGLDLSGADTSKEFFANDSRVEKWPQIITVSEWDATTKDGSLWGISEQMLHRSGIANPSDAQIEQLVDSLRPQAQANGWLAEGQKLDLRPALDVLGQIS